jgi:hypothetical protein
VENSTRGSFEISKVTLCGKFQILSFSELTFQIFLTDFNLNL